MEEPKPEASQTPADESSSSGSQPEPVQTLPADALSKTSEQLAEDAVNATGSMDSSAAAAAPVKKPNAVKAFFKKVNVYLLAFLLIVAIVAATGVVSYLNSKKIPKSAAIASQPLDTNALKQLANSDATIGNTSQTLTVQGNAIIAGQMLVQKDLDVAGRMRLGGELQVQTLTVAGKSNLADVQINSLQVANNVAAQGSTTLKDLNVAGTTSFSGAITASQITVTKLVLSGNATLQVPNHIAFTGAPPSRSVDYTSLGAGGTASINGSDTTGSININTGNNPVPGCFVKINFAQGYTSQPHVIISPVGAGAGQTQYYVNRTTAGFSVCSASAAPANQVFGFDYFVTN